MKLGWVVYASQLLLCQTDIRIEDGIGSLLCMLEHWRESQIVPIHVLKFLEDRKGFGLDFAGAKLMYQYMSLLRHWPSNVCESHPAQRHRQLIWGAGKPLGQQMDCLACGSPKTQQLHVELKLGSWYRNGKQWPKRSWRRECRPAVKTPQSAAHWMAPYDEMMSAIRTFVFDQRLQCNARRCTQTLNEAIELNKQPRITGPPATTINLSSFTTLKGKTRPNVQSNKNDLPLQQQT
ncbi:hypothetical protein OG21DRAFT_1603173 [Imleria badia]|nr:hypothetical protein OG21DRAFT_1603173 [Imleria badia]